MTIDLVVFDLGNVISIVDEWTPASELANQLGISSERVLEAVFAPQSKRPMEIGAQNWEQFVEACNRRLGVPTPEPILRDAYLSALRQNLAIFPLIDRLMANMQVGLCSNTSRIHWEAERAKLPMSGRL